MNAALDIYYVEGCIHEYIIFVNSTNILYLLSRIGFPIGT